MDRLRRESLSTQLTPTRSNSYILKQFKGIGCHGDGGSSSKCATFIEEKIGKHIDVTTMAYNRLMNHIRHMVSRAATGEKLKVDLNQFIEKNYPESFALAGEICKELGKDLNHEFLDNETGYLAIHIEQIKCDEMVSE